MGFLKPMVRAVGAKISQYRAGLLKTAQSAVADGRTKRVAAAGTECSNGLQYTYLHG
jgi:hypothetical protein